MGDQSYPRPATLCGRKSSNNRGCSACFLFFKDISQIQGQAHAMTTHLGAGAAQAIEVSSSCLMIARQVLETCQINF